MQYLSYHLGQNIPAGGSALVAGAAVMLCENGKTRAINGVACDNRITA